MLATSSPLILTPSTYLAGRLWGFLLCTTLLSAVLCCLCEVFYKWNPSSTVFCCYDPLFVIFSWISVCLFKLEELVDIVFLSSSWSYCYSVGLVSWTEFHSAIFTMYLSLGQRCDSQRQPPISFFCGFWTNIEYLHSYLWMGFICASILLLQSLSCQSLRQHHSW